MPALLGLLVLLLVGFTGWQALQAKTELEKVAGDFDALGGQIASGDLPAARATLAEAQTNARASVRHTRGPGWWVAARLPQLGPNVEAIRTVAGTTQRLADGVLPDVVSTAATLSPDSLRPVDGRIDLAPIAASEPAVVRAASRLATESDRVQRIDPTPLVTQIAAPVEELQTRIADAADLADRASRAVRLLPPMLGGDGRRTYLFLFQNNAEVRATGGIPGAFATITADRGRLTLGRQDDARTIGEFRRPPTPLTAEERAVFGPGLGLFPQDVNFTPDFPRSAQLVSGMYRATNRRTVDGVVSVDPVALSYLLRGTGPVRASGRELTADNAVQLLLSQVYADIADPDRQNVFFDAAARSVFDAVSSGTGDPRTLLEGLVTSASERRLLVWSAHPGEQRLLAPTALGGGLAAHDPHAPQVGVYLNAALPYKLDYYLDHEVAVRSVSCVGDRQQLTTTVTLRSTVPKDLSSLSEYVAPRAVPLFGAGTIATTVYFFAPEGGSLRWLSVDGEREKVVRQSLDGRTVFARTITLKRGQQRSLTVDVLAGPGQTGTPEVRTTPGVRSTGLGAIQTSACS
ncbi:DUF4012 domain-containing protein [Nocardioides panacis]|uniref:DUF4012 domain-containing protein n=1 Tax=Nocardioides panacis TaxID=2849501 RepID=A0A975SYG2_9ACTN|nr:DUF4012 domain-containing protein [Nocardioides panacis]QWZ08112.1 DUF4012 domain-containing protein [Nocardioides panacis]